jgi:thioredoxin-like negative regulator of GroEL
MHLKRGDNLVKTEFNTGLRREWMILQKVYSYQEIDDLVQQHPVCLLFLESEACQICHAVRPHIEKMVDEISGVNGLYGSVDMIQEAAGQYLIFAVPAVLVFLDGREVFRGARFIDLQQLESVLRTITAAGTE